MDDAERAVRSFKYMLLTKIMTNNQDDVNQLLASKHGLKYAGKVGLSLINSRTWKP
jgi:26S proteasome regulatory subunit N6